MHEEEAIADFGGCAALAQNPCPVRVYPKEEGSVPGEIPEGNGKAVCGFLRLYRKINPAKT